MSGSASCPGSGARHRRAGRRDRPDHEHRGAGHRLRGHRGAAHPDAGHPHPAHRDADHPDRAHPGAASHRDPAVAACPGSGRTGCCPDAASPRGPSACPGSRRTGCYRGAAPTGAEHPDAAHGSRRRHRGPDAGRACGPESVPRRGRTEPVPGGDPASEPSDGRRAPRASSQPPEPTSCRAPRGCRESTEPGPAHRTRRRVPRAEPGRASRARAGPAWAHRNRRSGPGHPEPERECPAMRPERPAPRALRGSTASPDRGSDGPGGRPEPGRDDPGSGGHRGPATDRAWDARVRTVWRRAHAAERAWRPRRRTCRQVRRGSSRGSCGPPAARSSSWPSGRIPLGSSDG